MATSSELTHTGLLQRYRPVSVQTAREAYLLSERRFSRLLGFEFTSAHRTRMTSSGPRFRGWSIAVVRSTGHRIELGDDDKLSLLFPYAGRIEVSRGGTTVEAAPDDLIVVGQGRRVTRLSPDYLGVLIQIPNAAMPALHAAAQIDRPASAPNDLRLLRGRGPVLVTARHLVEELEHTARPMQREEDWLSLLSPLWTAYVDRSEAPASPSRHSAAMLHVKLAEEYMRANFHRPLSVNDMATACAVGPRALQLAFRRYRGISPIKALADLRLQQARHRLASPAATGSITRIALDCGFTHLGRFSVEYRRAFGETPSQTRRRHQ